MRVPLSWLAELVRLTEPVDVLAERLTMAGLAVDAVDRVGDLDARIRVGRVTDVGAHPDADRLRVCRVDLGGADAATIVTGAPGVRTGLRLAVATPGARLADGTVVSARVVRGVASEGTLCSEAEAGLGSDAGVLVTLPVGVSPGTPVGDVAGIRDTVLELDVTPNRGDCLSMLGVAREIAAVTGGRLRRRAGAVREGGAPAAAAVHVRIDDAERCARYGARIVRGVRVRVSPLWLRLRLLRAGMRPINSIVDATNYVMLECGQPMHAFDLERIAGAEILVRRARAGERLTTLDEVERVLEPEDLVIADREGAIALAGVMGGARTEVGDATTALLLESAFFSPFTVRRTARRLALGSEASQRFERRVDPEGVRPALDRLAALVVRLSGGTVAPGVVEDAPGMGRLAAPTIVLRPTRAAAVLGVPLAAGEVRRRLRAVGARVARAGRDLRVVPPSHRGDLHAEEDLIEELARIGGYDAVPPTLPVIPVRSAADAAARVLARRVRRLLVAEGLSEAVTPPFVAPGLDAVIGCGARTDGGATIALRNPLSSDLAVLRRSPLAGLVRAVRTNLDRGIGFVGAFEIGRGFARDGAGAEQERRALAMVLVGAWPPRGAERSGPEVAFADLKGIVENVLEGLGVRPDETQWCAGASSDLWHPGRSATVRVGRRTLGAIGAVHPSAAQALDIPAESLLGELDFEELAHYRPTFSLRPLPRYPAVTRDIAVVVEEEFPAHAVLDEVARLNQPLIESVRLFDCYRGDPVPAGRKSLAYTIAYRAHDRTLTDDEVGALHDEVRARLCERFTLDLRS